MEAVEPSLMMRCSRSLYLDGLSLVSESMEYSLSVSVCDQEDSNFIESPVKTAALPATILAKISVSALPGGLFLLKGSFFYSPLSACMLRTGDWIQQMIQCDLMVSLARQLFIEFTLHEYKNTKLDSFEFELDWAVLLKHLEINLVVNWRYINKLFIKKEA